MPSLYVALLFTVLILSSQQSQAQMSQHFLENLQPRYEIGVGAIGLNTPDYPGSQQNKIRVIPFPWIIYRGKVVRLDDEGNRAKLTSSSRYEIGVQPSFSFPVKSDQNSIRQGLPDLDYIVGLGPRLLLRFLPHHSSHRLNFSIATIGHHATNFKTRFRFQGLSINSALSHWYSWNENLTLFSRVKLQFGSTQHNRYFYEVRPHEATPKRPAYEAKPGLVTSSLSLGGGSKLFNNLFIFSSFSWRNLKLSANKKSPLLETTNNLSFVLGIIWTFWESKEMVPRLSLKNRD